MRRKTTNVSLLMVLLVMLLMTRSTGAHGIGKAQVLNEPAGPYLISAWTDPDPLRADETHVVVGVSDPETREPIVTGIEVTVTLTSADDPTVAITEVAGTDNVNQLLYAAEFNDRVSEGHWHVGISVSGEQGSGATTAIEVDIEPARGFNMLWWGVGGMAIIVLAWIIGSMRGEKPPRPRRARPSAKPD